ncbi:protein-disulfide isomerase [Actinocorallia herbida]|uniref:Protein-disulfide isomerase n=1 Tax=Actinocorallia herbida TaxID=58109 RepID=A0A3N1D137_9ACTN|nr:thioredoxin domain-containing protein [Actinocorallia herbida]ROO87221.1 protein-disulfide isomerase [Actinocorallia herbida]
MTGKTSGNTSGDARNKSSARVEIERRRAAERRAGLLRRALIGAVAVLALAGAIFVAIKTADTGPAANGPLVAPAHAQGTTVTYGSASAPRTLDLFEDFRCPVCKNLEQTQGTEMQALADEGKIKINYHFGTFLDRNLGGEGSLAALAAAGAALDQSVAKFKAFHDALYAAQPEESSDAFADPDTLLEIAAKVPGLRGSTFDRQVRDGVFRPWASQVSAAFDSSGVQGTPTALLDGTELDLASGSLRTLVEQAK